LILSVLESLIEKALRPELSALLPSIAAALGTALYLCTYVSTGQHGAAAPSVLLEK